MEETLLAALRSLVATGWHEPLQCSFHRWRYALPTVPIESRALWDGQASLGACGDWCGGPRVEGAFLSGAALAGRVMNSILVDTSHGRRQGTLFAD